MNMLCYMAKQTADVVNIMDFEMGSYTGLSGLSLIMWFFKSRELQLEAASRDVTEGEIEENQS